MTQSPEEYGARPQGTGVIEQWNDDCGIIVSLQQVVRVVAGSVTATNIADECSSNRDKLTLHIGANRADRQRSGNFRSI
jgi:hypothetical protein